MLRPRASVGRCLLDRAQEPPIAFASGSGQHAFCGFQLVLGLLFLQQVNVETPFFDVVDDGRPCQHYPGDIAQPGQGPMIGRKKDQAVRPVPRFAAVIANAVEHRIECDAASPVCEYQLSGGRTTMRRALSSGTSP